MTKQSHTPKDWYEHRHELEPGMVFINNEGLAVKLTCRVPGDGTKWYVATMIRDWSYEDDTVEPGDLRAGPFTEDAIAKVISKTISKVEASDASGE